MTSPTTVGVANTHPPVLYSHRIFGALCAGCSARISKARTNAITIRPLIYIQYGNLHDGSGRSILSRREIRHWDFENSDKSRARRARSPLRELHATAERKEEQGNRSVQPTRSSGARSAPCLANGPQRNSLRRTKAASAHSRYSTAAVDRRAA